jgi:hypothetical protein
MEASDVHRPTRPTGFGGSHAHARGSRKDGLAEELCWGLDAT